MASVQFSGIGVTGARNKVGDVVYTRNRAGSSVRSFVIPANTITPARTAVRGYFSAAVSGWQLLSQSDVNAWCLLASRIDKINKVTGRHKVTGRSLYLESTMNFLSAGEFPIDAPGLKAISQPVKSVSISVLSNFEIFVAPVYLNNSSVVPASHVTVIQASPSVSSGINYPKNFFRIIRAFDAGVDISAIDLFADYEFVFGAPISGQKVFFRVTQFNVLLGLKCAPVTVAGIVS